MTLTRPHRRKLACTALLLALAACSTTAPIYTVRAVQFPREGLLFEVGVGIERAARLQNWEVEARERGMLALRKRKGPGHIARAHVRYDERQFSIEPAESVGLRQGEDRIHAIYNEWVKTLEATILVEVAGNR